MATPWSTSLGRACSLLRLEKSAIRPLGQALSPFAVPVTRKLPVQTRTYYADRSRQQEEEEVSFIDRTRLVPASPSYYTGNAAFLDKYLSLQDLYRKYEMLPTIPGEDAPIRKWRTMSSFGTMLGTKIQPSKYKKVIDILKRLNRINPAFMPEDCQAVLAQYSKGSGVASEAAEGKKLWRGFSVATGRRKTSTAVAHVIEGTGQVKVNGMDLSDTFPRIHDRESVIWALKATGRMDRYNVWLTCSGGGTTGQAEAAALAVSRALMVHEPLLKPVMRRGQYYSSIRPCVYMMLTEFYSWTCNSRSKTSRKKEARSSQGSQDANL
jgi:small subunit ribosomal protein S9